MVTPCVGEAWVQCPSPAGAARGSRLGASEAPSVARFGAGSRLGRIMNAVLWAVLTVLLGSTCWYAVFRGQRPLFAATKVATMGAMIGWAWSLGAAGTRPGIAVLVGMGLGLLGDAFLLLEQEWAFVAGLSAFLLGHLAYVLAFTTSWFSPAGAAVALLLAGGLAARIGPRLRTAAIADEGPMMGWAVTGYLLVIAAMAVAAGATGRPLVLIGALLFVVSDAVLALDRFVAPRPRAHLVVMVTYHLAQAAIMLGMLA